MTDQQPDITPLIDLDGIKLPNPGELVPLKPAQRARIVAEFEAKYEDAKRGHNVKKRREQDQKWWALYNCSKRLQPKGWPLTDRDGGKHSSNLNVAVERGLVDGMRSQIAQNTYKLNPVFRYRAKDDDAEERAALAEDYMGRVCEDDIRFPVKGDEAITMAFVEGECYLFSPWRKEIEPRMVASSIGTDEDGMPALIPASVEEVVAYDGLRLEVVSHNDLLTYPASEKDPDKADMLFYTVEIARSSILQGAKDGEFYKLTTEDKGKLNAGDKLPQKADEGGSDYEATPETVPTRYKAVDVYFPYDIEGDGFEIDCVGTWLPDQQMLLKVTPSNTQKPRPFTLGWMYPDGKGGGVSILALTESQIAAINQLENQRNDIVTYNIMAALTPIIPESMGADLTGDWLGAPVYVNGDARMIGFLPQISTVEVDNDIERQYRSIELITGWSRNSAGAFNPRPTTAHEVSEVANEANLRFQLVLEALDECFKTLGVKMTKFMSLFLPLQGVTYSAEPTDDEAQQYKDQVMGQQHEQAMAEIAQKPEVQAQMQLGAPDVMQAAAAAGVQPPDIQPPKQIPLTQKTVTRETFADGIECIVEGSRAGFNRDMEHQKGLETYALLSQSPLVNQDVKHLWEVTRPLIQDQRKVEDTIGPKPQDSKSVPQFVAEMSPPPPPGPAEPPVKEVDSTNYKDLPPDVQAEWLSKQGFQVTPQSTAAVHPANPANKPPPPQIGKPGGNGAASRGGPGPSQPLTGAPR